MTDNQKTELLKDFETLDPADTVECDHLFEKWGAGQTLFGIDRPYERLEMYRDVLEVIQQADPEKYKTIHKGTSFFFCGLLLFDLKYFESAIFYFTAALAEDRRRSGSTSLKDYVSTPAGQILSLNQSPKWMRFASVFRDSIKGLLDKYNAEYGTSHSVEDFTQKFIHPMLEQEHYAIITSLYSYALDYDEKSKNLRLGGGSVDSMEPILVSLFKGALIFETLLKYYYPLNNQGQKIMTLGGFTNNSVFNSDFPGANLSKPTTTMQDIVDDCTDNSVKTTLEITARVRNTTGHKLVWDNVFTEPDNYRKLFEQEFFAILTVITKQW
ncbi:MAG: hypothetical protein V4702_02675 [Patescibacteria group bacterium]